MRTIIRSVAHCWLASNPNPSVIITVGGAGSDAISFTYARSSSASEVTLSALITSSSDSMPAGAQETGTSRATNNSPIIPINLLIGSLLFISSTPYIL